jgi:hypothetical protein
MKGVRRITGMKQDLAPLIDVAIETGDQPFALWLWKRIEQGPTHVTTMHLLRPVSGSCHCRQANTSGVWTLTDGTRSSDLALLIKMKKRFLLISKGGII